VSVVVDVVGAGGHAKVVLAALQAADVAVGVVVDRLADRVLLGRPVLPMESLPLGADRRVVVAIGNNATRKRVVDELVSRGHRFATVVHPTAWVAPTAELGEGAVVFAGAVIQPDVVVGAHAIVNTLASVDHDCVVGAFAHVAPGARLAGSVLVGDGTLVGVGASVIPGRRLGAWATVGAGAAVVHDVDAATTVVGVPARPLHQPG
jgi:sugar O-acyltransferase (sialic acid O-acetyltransferase NeuD family)